VRGVREGGARGGRAVTEKKACSACNGTKRLPAEGATYDRLSGWSATVACGYCTHEHECGYDRSGMLRGDTVDIPFEGGPSSSHGFGKDLTAIGRNAKAEQDGDIAISCTPDGSEQLTIRRDTWESLSPGHMTPRQVAEGAAETLVRALWGNELVSADSRGLVLQRLFDRMDDYSRKKSLEALIVEGLDLSRILKKR